MTEQGAASRDINSQSLVGMFRAIAFGGLAAYNAPISLSRTSPVLVAMGDHMGTSDVAARTKETYVSFRG